MNKTAIEWVKNPDGTQGYTHNPLTGCKYHTPEGFCKGGGFPCYAYKLAHGRLKQRYLDNDNLAQPLNPPLRHFDNGLPFYLDPKSDPFYPRFWKERLYDASDELCTLKPKGIFVCDMGELFGDWIPDKWIEDILDVAVTRPQHRFYLLTKQPQNLAEFSPFPENCWVGVTVCTNGMMTIALQHLSLIKAKVKYISFEPLLGQIGMNDHMNMKGIVDWLIIGAQTKPYKPPRIEWVREIAEAADRAEVPVFLKDNLAPLLINEKSMGNVSPGVLIERVIETGNYRLRQEMPE